MRWIYVRRAHPPPTPPTIPPKSASLGLVRSSWVNVERTAGIVVSGQTVEGKVGGWDARKASICFDSPVRVEGCLG